MQNSFVRKRFLSLVSIIAMLFFLFVVIERSFFSAGFSSKEIDQKFIPKIIDDLDLRNDGFKLKRGILELGWFKYDKFKWCIGDTFFTDSLRLVIYTDEFTYPVTYGYYVQMSHSVDTRFREGMKLEILKGSSQAHHEVIKYRIRVKGQTLLERYEVTGSPWIIYHIADNMPVWEQRQEIIGTFFFKCIRFYFDLLHPYKELVIDDPLVGASYLNFAGF